MVTSIKSITEIPKQTRPIGILGGGVSMPQDFAQLPKDCLIMAANHHCYKIDVTPDYYVFKDSPIKKPELKVGLNCEVVISKIEKYTHYKIDIPHYDRGETGMLALWLACFITSGRVYLCGMDGYSNPRIYFYDHPTQIRPNHGARLENQLDKWRMAITGHPNGSAPGVLNPSRVYSKGVLGNVFNEWV